MEREKDRSNIFSKSYYGKAEFYGLKRPLYSSLFHSLYHWRSSSHLIRGQLMSMDTIRTAYAENRPELITNRRVGGTDIIAAVRQALLGDIFVLMTRSYPLII